MAHTVQMIWHLVKREFQLRYAGSMLGFLWSLTVPLTQLLMLTFVFNKVIPLKIPNFPVFVFAAILPWNWFSSTLLASGDAFLGSRDLLRYPNFSPASIIAVNVVTHLMTFFLSLPILFGMLYWYDLEVPWMFIPALPVLILIQAMLITGLSFIIATANVFYRDVSQITSIIVSLLFFLTPIWYVPQVVGEYGIIFEINPMALIVQNYRMVLLEGRWLDWPSLLTAGFMSVAFLTAGYLTYRHWQSDMIDAI